MGEVWLEPSRRHNSKASSVHIRPVATRMLPLKRRLSFCVNATASSVTTNKRGRCLVFTSLLFIL